MTGRVGPAARPRGAGPDRDRAEYRPRPGPDATGDRAGPGPDATGDRAGPGPDGTWDRAGPGPDGTGNRPGDVDDLGRLFDRHAADPHRYLARRLDAATADDLVADTFLVAWERRAAYRPDRGSPRAWLFGIATNLLRHHARGEVRGLRARSRHAALAGPGADDVGQRAAARVDAGATVRRLARGLADLRAEDRDVLLLVAWAGLAPHEVAAALDLPVGTVRSRLHRARAALRGADPTSEEESRAR